MKTHMEYQELKIPQHILERIEAALHKIEETGAGEPPTMGEAGVMDWLTGLSRDEGWSVVWSAFNYPYFVFEREVLVEKAEK